MSALALMCAGLGAYGIGFVVHGFDPRAKPVRGADLAARVDPRPSRPPVRQEETREAKRPEPRVRGIGRTAPLDPRERPAYERLMAEIGRPAPRRDRLEDWAAWQVQRIQDHLAAYPRSARAFELFQWLLVNQIDVLGRYADAEGTLAGLESLIENEGGKAAEAARVRALRLRVRLYALWNKPGREQAAIQRLLPVAGPAEQRLWRGRLYELSCLVPGRPLPVVNGTGLKGEAVSPKMWHGNVLCLTFWDPGDRSAEQGFRCRRQARTAFQDQGLFLLDVPLGRSRPVVEAHLDRHGVDWPQLWDDQRPGNDHPVARRFTPTGRPTSFLVDRNGVIRYRDLRGRELLRRIEELLRRAAGSAD